MTIWLRVGSAWLESPSPQVRVGNQAMRVNRGHVYVNGKWERFYPRFETTVTERTSGLTGTLYVDTPSTVNGRITPASGRVRGGTVTAFARPVGGGASGNLLQSGYMTDATRWLWAGYGYDNFQSPATIQSNGVRLAYSPGDPGVPVLGGIWVDLVAGQRYRLRVTAISGGGQAARWRASVGWNFSGNEVSPNGSAQTSEVEFVAPETKTYLVGVESWPEVAGLAHLVTAMELVSVSGWEQVGQTAVTASVSGPATFALSVTPRRCGQQEFYLAYGGSSENNPSDSAPIVANVALAAPGKPTGGAIAATTMAFTWTATLGATAYEVYRNNVLVGTVTTPSYTATDLTPATTYSFTVRAKNGTCVSALSPALTGQTSRTSVRDTGSATINIDPSATNSYRPDVGWGYIGSAVGQGYYTDSGRNYTGIIDYGTNAAFKAKIAAALGANGDQRAANLTISDADIYLFKQTGVGSSGAVNTSFFASTAAAGSGGAPARSGTEVVIASSASGSAKWYNVGAAHARALLAGTARSIAIYKATTAAYLRFNGKGVSTNSCVLRLAVSWDYQLATSVAGSWTN